MCKVVSKEVLAKEHATIRQGQTYAMRKTRSALLCNRGRYKEILHLIY